MPNLSDLIEAYLKQLLSQHNSPYIEIQRRELADLFDCVPSQITYVLQTRFTPQRGYRVESVRGGGGYIRIIKQTVDDEIAKRINRRFSQKEAHFLLEELYERGLLSHREMTMIKIATSNHYLGLNGREADLVRGRLLRALCSFCIANK